ncbi:MAG: ABC transporter ATP-binding protein [candidate division KSB1 bacterium]|nr:ABC transporter ATP-binding protein [candidate division KSB1 bacterium]
MNSGSSRDRNGPPRLELRNLTKFFGGVAAVRNVSVAFSPNKITALIGPNGAGKTTLFNLVCGYLRPSAGSVLLGGEDVTDRKPWEMARLGIGRLFQDVRVFSKLTVLENVMVAFPKQTGEEFWHPIVRRRQTLQSERASRDRAYSLLEFVTLADKANTLAENLSFGQQKLLAIARLLAMDAKILLLDEPASGVHPALLESILSLMISLAKQGKMIIFIEHNLGVVLELAHWVYVLDEGEVVAFGLPDEVIHDKTTREAYLGV